jgi:hypothetical protein
LTQLEHNIRSTDQKEADENDDELVEVGHDIEEENGTERLSENDL